MSTDSTHKTKEIHYGIFGSLPAWSPDGKKIAIGEYRRGSYGSIIWDIREIDVETGKKRWLTRNLRANHPDWSPDGKSLVFIAHPGETTNLYVIRKGEEKPVLLTKFTGDVQILHPRWSPDGKFIVFSIQDTTGAVNIALVKKDGSGLQYLTDDKDEDLLPVWSHDGKSVIFTSFRNSTPNLYRISIEKNPGKLVQMTDVAEGVISFGQIPNSGDILVNTLADVDTPRVMRVSQDRTIEPLPFNIRNRYYTWRDRSPEISITSIDYTSRISFEGPKKYRALSTIRPVVWIALPGETGLGLMGAFIDAMGKHIIYSAGELGWQGRINSFYLGYANAAFAPITSLDYFFNSRGSIRGYNSSSLFERLDGWRVSADFPFNAGNSLFSNHNLNVRVIFQQRTVTTPEPQTGKRPEPEEGKEGILSVGYRWLNRRPHNANIFLPKSGYGIRFRFNRSLKSLYGDFDYSRYETEGFINMAIPKSPFVLFSRVRWDGLRGNFPAQDSLGVTEDFTYYLPRGSILQVLYQGFLETPEVYGLRGYNQVHLGDRVLYGSLEIRMPLMPGLPINIFGINPGHFSWALFTDFGKVWGNKNKDMIFTAGAEVKWEVRIGEAVLIAFASGVGQTPERWRRNKNPYYYLRLAMINPF
jgi:hypothetical protein